MIGQLGNLGQLGISGGSRQLLPRQLSGCMWEYDLYRWDTLFQDRNGTIPFTAYGQPIGLLLDLSGNGHHRFSVSAARPTLELSASGKPCLYYPGTGRYMQTNPFAWGSDEVCVIMGVRKLSDAAIGQIVEFSTAVSTYAGAFSMPTNDTSASYAFASKGTTGVLVAEKTGYTSPTTNILTGIGVISRDILRLRVDGVLVAESTGDQGSGNYGTYALYFGARAGTSLFLNGYEFSSCAFNKIPTDAQLAAMNRYINNKTGAY